MISEETRRKLSESKTGKNNSQYGKPLSEEHKAKISLAVSGENNGFYGKTHSEELKERWSKERTDNSWVVIPYKFKSTFERYRVKQSIKKYQGIEGIDYTECKICGRRALYLDERHLKNNHGITKEEYIEKFPNVCICSEKKSNSQSRPGELNACWNGGDWEGTGYCREFTKEYKNFIKERDGFTCLNPICRKNSNNITVHHIDFDKHNCIPENLITVCVSCNSIANLDRVWYKFWYQAILYNRYGYSY